MEKEGTGDSLDIFVAWKGRKWKGKERRGEKYTGTEYCGRRGGEKSRCREEKVN